MTEQQKEQFCTLQRKEEDSVLSHDEKLQLREFREQIEAEEATLLATGLELLRQERRQIEEQNAVLASLIHRKERLARRLERVLELSLAERKRIETEETAMLAAISRGNTR